MRILITKQEGKGNFNPDKWIHVDDVLRLLKKSTQLHLYPPEYDEIIAQLEYSDNS